MSRKRRAIAPYVAPPDAPPLREVFRTLIAKQQELNKLDDEIGQRLAQTEQIFRTRYTTGYPVSVPFPPWGKLAWSGRRGHWRLVVIDDEECEDLSQMPARCRADACHALRALAERMRLQ